MRVIVSEPDLSAEAGPACVLGCLAVCLLLLLRTERASRVSGELHGCKPRGARGACTLRRAACQSSEFIRAYTRQTGQDSPTSNSWRAACRRLPRTTYHGLTRGVSRVSHRAAADARIVAGGLRRRWHRLLQRAYGLRRHLQRHRTMRSVNPPAVCHRRTYRRAPRTQHLNPAHTRAQPTGTARPLLLGRRRALETVDAEVDDAGSTMPSTAPAVAAVVSAA